MYWKIGDELKIKISEAFLCRNSLELTEHHD